MNIMNIICEILYSAQYLMCIKSFGAIKQNPIMLTFLAAERPPKTKGIVQYLKYLEQKVFILFF